MTGDIEFAILAVSSIIAVMGPASTLVTYISLTEDMSEQERIEVAKKSMKISFIVLAFFALTGHLLFSIFRITPAAFRIAGGILLVSVALEMLAPKKRQQTQGEYESVAIIPLAFPLTAGPGTITTTILLVSEAQSLLQSIFVFIAIALGILLLYIGMQYAFKITKFISDEGLHVITKLMSVIVMSIAVQFIIEGIQSAITIISG